MKATDDKPMVQPAHQGSRVPGAAGDRLQTCPTLSDRARREMLAQPGEPFWLCDWTDVVFIHFEVDADGLQREVPFELDLHDGRAFVSLVAFTLADMRPRVGGAIARWLFQPFGTHRFLNVRTYVRHHGQAGIYFLAEWLDAPRLNLLAGPLLYGLPFRCGCLHYENRPVNGRVRGTVRDRAGTVAYSGTIADPPQPSGAGTCDEFLVERYRAFTWRGNRRGWFPVWHPPWKLANLAIELSDRSLLRSVGSWFARARLQAAHCSTGAGGVWMGRWRAAVGPTPPPDSTPPKATILPGAATHGSGRGAGTTPLGTHCGAAVAY